MAKANDKAKAKAKAKSAEKPAKGEGETKAAKPRKGAGGAEPKGFRGYLTRTRYPLYSILFVVPLALFYEFGVVKVNEPIIATHGSEMRVTADKIIRDALGWFLDLCGVHGAAARPGDFGVASVIVLILVLLGWQIACRKGWDVRPLTLLGVAGEAVLFGFLWFLAAYYVIDPLAKMTIENESARWLTSGAFREIVFAAGAGVYEEFLFRMLLVWVIAVVVAGITSLEWDPSRFIAVLLAAVVFSAHHHIGLSGEPFTWMMFAYRAVAGAFFGIVYYLRGFGVAVGCHAMYNVCVYFFISPQYLFGG